MTLNTSGDLDKKLNRATFSHILSRKIMVISDDKNNRKRLSKIIGDEYEIISSGERSESISLLEKYGGEITLILLDLIEPVVDGYPFLTYLKKTPTISEIPVIVVIQSDDEEEELKALASGADEFIRLPYRARIVKNRVNNILKLREKAIMISLMKYDKLTGIYNKEFFFQEAEELMEQDQDQNFDVICCNIESFSSINDMYGHHFGDRLLIHLAQILKDFIAGKGMCCRVHADIFLMFVETGIEYSKELFEDLKTQLNQVFDICHVDIDFGIYHINEKHITMNLACDRAQMAIENVKGDFSKFYAVYDDRIRQERLFIQKIVGQMRTALINNEFQVYFQPKYSLDNDSVVGAEALVRWISKEDGFISPGSFIPIFEKNKFITELDKYVWEQVCIFKKKCVDKGIPNISISVNVSYEDLFDDDLPEFMLQLVQKYNILPETFHLEITESVYTHNPRPIIERATRLREYGFIIEMDDFGKGYSSLNMLGELPVDVLKLDMKFMQSSSTINANSIYILRFVIELAKWMNLTVIAEGVETKEQMEHLKEFRCDYAQGYYFARPMPEEDFIKLLNSSRVQNTF